MSSTSLVLDANGGFPAVRPATDEDNERDWVFELSPAGIVQIGQTADVIISTEPASCVDSRLKLARLKLYLVDIGQGQYQELPMNIVEKVRRLAAGIFSRTKIKSYDFVDLIGFCTGLLHKSTVEAYVCVLFIELEEALEQEDRLGQMLCVEKIIDIEKIVNKHLANEGVYLYGEIAKAITWLQQRIDVQKINSFVEWAVAQITLDDVGSHAVGKRIEKVYSFVERYLPQVGGFFYKCLGERITFFINGFSASKDTCELLGDIVKSLEIWRDFGINPMLRLDDNFNLFFDNFLQQAREFLLKKILTLPVEERCSSLRILRQSNHVKEETFIEELLKQDLSLLYSYMMSMEREAHELLSAPFCSGTSFILSKSGKIFEILKNVERLKGVLIENNFFPKEILYDIIRIHFWPSGCFVLQNYLLYQKDVKEILAMFYCIEKLFPFNCPLELIPKDLERFGMLLESFAPCYEDLRICIQDLPLVDWQKEQLFQMCENAGTDLSY